MVSYKIRAVEAPTHASCSAQRSSSEDAAAAVIVVRRVDVVLLVGLDQNDLFEGLPYILLLQLVAEGDLVREALFLPVWLAFAL